MIGMSLKYSRTYCSVLIRPSISFTVAFFSTWRTTAESICCEGTEATVGCPEPVTDEITINKPIAVKFKISFILDGNSGVQLQFMKINWGWTDRREKLR